MTLDESKKLLADMYDALNAQDLEAQHKYWHDDMVWHGPPGFGDIHGICLLYTSPSPRDP